MNLLLTADVVQIWYARLEVPRSEFMILSKTLSPDEYVRASRYRLEEDKIHFIVSRGILRTILGGYLDIEPGRVQFHYGKYGKPEIDGRNYRKNVCFNLSHSNGLALFAFTLGFRIGIDVEKIRNISEMAQIAERFFSEEENKLFRSLPEEQRTQAFFNCWTRKEAFIKATGEGLSLPLDSFAVSLIPGEPAELLNICGNEDSTANWSLQSFSPSPSFIGAFATEKASCRPTYRSWSACSI